ncbi:MAG: HD domain-containing protein [Oscillospiraceae bacterium]|nr:HD domain-containing protein [Oscillospiraceae bacterium]
MSTRTFNKIIEKNERDANRTVASVMAITFAFFTLIYILNLTGVFVIDTIPMTIAYCTGGITLMLPMLINKIFGTASRSLKYIYVSFAAFFLLVITSVLTYHVVVIYAFPIAIAGIYFSKKVTRIASVMTAAVTVCGQLTAYALGRPDDNFPTLKALVIYGILPRLLILICLAALLEHLTARTSALLKEDAENYEQQVLYSKNMIYGFATLVENRDENTGGHIKRTSIYSAMLATKLKSKGIYTDTINDDYIKCLSMVAPLHDIGKISIPDSVLCKPGKLTDEEFDIMKSHAAKGGEIIKDTFSAVTDENYRTMAYEVARYHHEKWNGRGYPEGLSGEEIPLSARIMAVADVFDAVSEKRCYRDAMPLEKCFAIISEGIDRDFDPAVADAFLEMRDEITKVRETGEFTPVS